MVGCAGEGSGVTLQVLVTEGLQMLTPGEKAIVEASLEVVLEGRHRAKLQGESHACAKRELWMNVRLRAARNKGKVI